MKRLLTQMTTMIVCSHWVLKYSSYIINNNDVYYNQMYMYVYARHRGIFHDVVIFFNFSCNYDVMVIVYRDVIVGNRLISSISHELIYYN